MESIFLAFAWLFPDFRFCIFFLLPVKMKWLGLVGVDRVLGCIPDGKLDHSGPKWRRGH